MVHAERLAFDQDITIHLSLTAADKAISGIEAFEELPVMSVFLNVLRAVEQYNSYICLLETERLVTVSCSQPIVSDSFEHELHICSNDLFVFVVFGGPNQSRHAMIIEINKIVMLWLPCEKSESDCP